MIDTPNKRDPGQFEPPPWEREQFEEFQRKREEQAQEHAEETLPEQTSSVAELVVEEKIDVAQESLGQAAAPTQEPPGKESPGGAEVDEKAMAAMLLQLQIEEPESSSALWKIGLVFSVGAVGIGLVLLVWGFVAMVRTGALGPAGIVGSTILMAFGGLFVGLGIWTAVRSLKQRGVL